MVDNRVREEVETHFERESDPLGWFIRSRRGIWALLSYLKIALFVIVILFMTNKYFEAKRKLNECLKPHAEVMIK